MILRFKAPPKSYSSQVHPFETLPQDLASSPAKGVSPWSWRHSELPNRAYHTWYVGQKRFQLITVSQVSKWYWSRGIQEWTNRKSQTLKLIKSFEKPPMMAFLTFCCHPNRLSLGCIGYQDASHEEATHPLGKTPRLSCWKLNANRKPGEHQSRRVRIREGNERLLRVSLKTFDFVWKRYWIWDLKMFPGWTFSLSAIWARARRQLDEGLTRNRTNSILVTHFQVGIEVIQVIQQWFQTWIFPNGSWSLAQIQTNSQKSKVWRLQCVGHHHMRVAILMVVVHGWP